MNKILKAIICAILEIVIFFSILIGIIAIGFSSNYNIKDTDFYSVTILVLGVLLMIIVPLSFYLKRRKILLAAWCIWGALFIIPISVYEGIKAYEKSLIVSIPLVDLTQYQPFSENNKIATLDQPPTLTFTDSLPNLDGATAFYPLYAAFVQAVYPYDNYDIDTSIVKCRKTNRAYEHLLFDGDTDILFAFEPSENQEKEIQGYAETSYNLTPIGKEAFVFFVNVKNPVDNLSTEQLQDIYTGKITNWKEVGGNDKAIKAFQRNEDSGSQTIFLKFMGEKTPMTPPQETFVGFMEGIIYKTSDYANHGSAIGYTFRYFAEEMVANNDIKLLKINGVYPNYETIHNNTYPLLYEFHAVTRADREMTSNSRRFIEWILSPQGQQLVEKTGYCAIHPVN